MGQETQEWTSDQWKSVLWSDESKSEIFGSTRRVFVDTEKVNDGLYMHGSLREAWRRCDGVGCYAGDTFGDLFITEGALNQHGYHSILQPHAIPSSLCLVGPSFIF